MKTIEVLASRREGRTVPVRGAIRVTGAMVGGERVLPCARGSFSAADRDHAAERFDAIAGCEFLDDRIRRLE